MNRTRNLVLDTDLIPAVCVQSQLLQSVAQQLATIGTARKASSFGAIQAASAALALVRENKVKSTKLAAFKSALFAAHAARTVILVGYGDAVLDRACNGKREEPQLEEMFIKCKQEMLHTEDELNWAWGKHLLAALVFTANEPTGIAMDGNDDGLEEWFDRDLSLANVNLAALRHAMNETQQVWSQYSLNFQETCNLAIAALLQEEFTSHYHPALICALLGCSYNLAKRQVVGSTKAKALVTIVLHGDLLDVETRSACFSAVIAVDDLWNRFRNPKQPSSAVTPPAAAGVHVENCLTAYAQEVDDAVTQTWLFQVALGLTQVVARLNAPHALPQQVNPRVLDIAREVRHLRNEGTSLSAVGIAWEAMQLRARLHARLFNDWTSEEETSDDDEDATPTRNERLFEVRNAAARYAVFQTTHPDDRQVLLYGTPPIQLRHYEPARALQDEYYSDDTSDNSSYSDEEE